MSRIIQGLMRAESLSDEELYNLIQFDLEHGINFFDLADCYGDGRVEEKLGRILSSHKGLREKMIIQTKCSIVRGVNKYYDLSYEHIMESVYNSLKRMNITYLDFLLLHRPDILMDNEEIKKAFMELKEKGLVRHFGVSNFSKEAIEYLRVELGDMIEADQIQLGLGQMRLLEEEISFNINNDDAISHTGGTFFYLKKNHMEIQCWSPFLVGFFEGSLFDYGKYPNINHKLDELAYKYQVSKATVATKFLLMLDKNLKVVSGSMNKDHIMEMIYAESMTMEKVDWYGLYLAQGKMLP